MHLFGAFDFAAQQSFLKGKSARLVTTRQQLGIILLFVLKPKLWATKAFCKILHQPKTKLYVASCPLFLLLSPYSFQCAHVFS